MKAFKANGLWWTSEFPDHQVAGELSFDPSSGTVLTTIGDNFTHEIAELFGVESEMGTKMWNPEKVVIPFIHGYIDSGHPVTLCCCRQFGWNLATGYVGSRFVAQVAYKGSHFKNEDDIVFDQVGLDYTLLELWLGVAGLTGKVTSYSDGRPYRVEYAYEFSPPVIYPVHGYEISFHHDLSVKGDRVSTVQMIRNSTIEVKLNHPMDFSTLQREVVYHLRNFLTLATGSAIVPERVRGQSPNGPTDLGSGLPASIEMYYIARGGDSTPPPIDRWDMLFRYEDVSDDFGRLLGNWISKSERLRPVMDLYFSLFYIPSMYAHLEFLTLAQALETFHRTMYGGEYVSEDAYSSTKAKLESAIPSELEQSHKDSLKMRIKYGYQYSLSKRLNLLLEEILLPYKDTVSKLTAHDSKGFVRSVVDTRNYLTHYSEDDNSKPALESAAQYRLAQKLKLLMQICFLHEMGFTPDMVNSLVLNNTYSQRWLG